MTPQNIKQVGGVVFPDRPAKFDLNDFCEIVKAFKDVHLPTYGQEIPNSNSYFESSISSATTTKILTPAENEVIVVKALELTSSEAGTDVVLRLEHDSNSLVLSTNLTLTQNVPTALIGIQLKDSVAPFASEIKIAYPYSLSVQTLSSGTVDLAVKGLTIKTMQ
tara:strand:+ start:1954 stop:2445 length:492 start_codon:yes stop_codon:yes gene_type:complete